MQNAVQTVPSLEMALAIWHRRKWLALLVLLAALSVTFPVVRNLPTIYESMATVLVGRQQDQAGPLTPWAADELEARLRTLSQQILSRSRLYELITRLGLYRELRQRASPEAVVEQMRRDIRLQFNGVKQSTGVEGTVVFSLSYRGRDPETVAQVTNALAALYVQENTQQTPGTTEFLKAQLEEAKRQLEGQERRIGEFKMRHIGQLPEQQEVNLAALGRLNAQIVTIVGLQDALAKRLVDLPGTEGAAWAQLDKLRQEFADLRSRFTDEHPAVVQAKEEIAALERQLAASGSTHAPAGDPAMRPLKDPRVAAVEAELATLRAQEQGLRRAIAAYEQRVEITPLREQELQQLSRDYAAAKEHYQSLLQRYEGAQLAERMEQHVRGDQFRILDPAVATHLPVGPHRFQLLLMGLLGGMGAAVGMALLAESRDTSFHTVDHVRAFTSVPVLVSIPPIVTETDARRRRQQFGLAALAAAFGVAVLVIVASHLSHSNPALFSPLTAGRF